jgi:hypothetical protein
MPASNTMAAPPLEAAALDVSAMSPTPAGRKAHRPRQQGQRW